MIREKPKFPVIDSKGSEGQKRIEAVPDSTWEPKEPLADGLEEPPILKKAGFLLVTNGQCTKSARLTAVASDTAYIGNGWIPVQGFEPRQAKALAVFINSTIGRLQLLARPAKKLDFPQYNPNVVADLMIPDVTSEDVLTPLLCAWQKTKDKEVPQFREGENEIRCIWDHAVAEAIDFDRDEVDSWRHLLHREPIVSGRNYGEVTS